MVREVRDYPSMSCMAGMILVMTWLAVMRLPSWQVQDWGSRLPQGRAPPPISARLTLKVVPSRQVQNWGLWPSPQVGIPYWAAASLATFSGLKVCPLGQVQRSGTASAPVQGLVLYSMENWNSWPSVQRQKSGDSPSQGFRRFPRILCCSRGLFLMLFLMFSRNPPAVPAARSLAPSLATPPSTPPSTSRNPWGLLELQFSKPELRTNICLFLLFYYTQNNDQQSLHCRIVRDENETTLRGLSFICGEYRVQSVDSDSTGFLQKYHPYHDHSYSHSFGKWISGVDSLCFSNIFISFIYVMVGGND